MIAMLTNVSYFNALAPQELVQIEREALRKTCQTKEILFFEGERNGGLYLVESGWFKLVRYSTSGREQILNYLGPGETFNNIAAFTDAHNQATAIALEPSEALHIRSQVLHDLIRRNPDFAAQVIRDLANRLQHMASLVEDLSLKPLEARLARLLLENQASQGQPSQKWNTQTEMAARLGTVPEVLNRLLRKLRDEDIIEVYRSQVRILRTAPLERISQSD